MKRTKIKVTTYFKNLLKTEDAIGQIEDSSTGSYLREVFDEIDTYREYPDELFDIIRLVSIEQENGDFHDETFTTIVFKELKTKKFYSFTIHDNGSISTDAVSVDEFLTEVKPERKRSMNKILIVTDSEGGWDCLVGAYTDLESLKKHFEVPEELNTIPDVQEFIRKNALYVIHQTELK